MMKKVLTEVILFINVGVYDSKSIGYQLFSSRFDDLFIQIGYYFT